MEAVVAHEQIEKLRIDLRVMESRIEFLQKELESRISSKSEVSEVRVNETKDAIKSLEGWIRWTVTPSIGIGGTILIFILSQMFSLNAHFSDTKIANQADFARIEQEISSFRQDARQQFESLQRSIECLGKKK